MKKIKLIDARKRKQLSQQRIADYLCMDVSNYNRREKGQIKITQIEWRKLALVLEVPLEEIFESEDGLFLDKNTVNSGNYNSEMFTIPLFVLENQQKYISKLEEEILKLKAVKSEL